MGCFCVESNYILKLYSNNRKSINEKHNETSIEKTIQTGNKKSRFPGGSKIEDLLKYYFYTFCDIQEIIYMKYTLR